MQAGNGTKDKYSELIIYDDDYSRVQWDMLK